MPNGAADFSWNCWVFTLFAAPRTGKDCRTGSSCPSICTAPATGFEENTAILRAHILARGLRVPGSDYHRIAYVRASATSRIVSSANLPIAQAKAGDGKTGLGQLFSQMLEQASPTQSTKPSRKNAQDADGAQTEDQSASTTQNGDGDETQTATQTSTSTTTTSKLVDKAAAKTSTTAGSSGKSGNGNEIFAAWIGSDINANNSFVAPQTMGTDYLPAGQVAAQQKPQGSSSNNDQAQAEIGATANASAGNLATAAAQSNLSAATSAQNGISQAGQGANQAAAANAQNQLQSQNNTSSQAGPASSGFFAQGQVQSQNIPTGQAASASSVTSGSTVAGSAQSQSQSIPTSQAGSLISPSYGADMNQAAQNNPSSNPHSAGAAKAQSQAAQVMAADQTIALPSTDPTDALPETSGASVNTSGTIAGLPGANPSGKPGKAQDVGVAGGETSKAQAGRTDDSKADAQSSDVKQDPLPDQSYAVASDVPASKQELAQTANNDTSSLTITPSQSQTATQTAAPSHDQTAQTIAQSTTLQVSSLAVEISAKSLSGAKQFDIRLDPPELGQVDVRLSIDATGKVSAHLSADQPQTLHLLQKDAPTLTRALRDAGLNVSQNGLNFSLRQQSGGQTGASQGQSKARSFTVNANNSIEATPVANYRGLVDGRLDIRV
jgi:flagellar hook-length control protein FliK